MFVSNTVETLIDVVAKHIALLLDAHGVVLAMYSIIHTHGAARTHQEFASTTGLVSLIGDDACCEQVWSL